MVFELLKIFVKIIFCGLLLEDSVSYFNLTIAPRMLEFS
jgi:hypothetical protein